MESVGQIIGYELGDEEFAYDPSLALYLPLHELDGAQFRSRDAYGRLYTVTGALWQLPDGRKADGIDDRINGVTNIGITGIANRTVIVRVKFSAADLAASSIAPAIWWGNTGLPNGQVFSIVAYGHAGAGYWAMWGRGGGAFDIASNGALTADVEYHLCATYDGTTVRLYQNGVADNTGVVALVTTNDVVRIFERAGASGDRLWMSGSVKEAWIYTRTFSQSEVMQHKLATAR